ncbi:Phage-associated protein [Streptococcus sp. DD10]|uniref:hypothetical protein n=1 Tax=Streptococcus sp. DD10 TaxID=1777878 RepID=UPI00079C7464|nr:hypothetical protein [Streptococcus sp. DD10]KXT73196.1 Phage-associated protein [Streptococcus sp. DD10]
MIEKVIKRHLDSQLGVPSFYEHEEDMPERCVLIEKTGSGRRDFARSATFTFQSYAGSMQEAAELNEAVKVAVDSLIGLDAISGVRLNSDYNFTDTETKRYRYQAVYDIYYF